MGLVTTRLVLSNPREPALEPIEVAALADTGSLVLGDEVLLGAMAMQEMDLVVNPLDHSVDVNPNSPNIVQGIVKRAA